MFQPGDIIRYLPEENKLGINYTNEVYIIISTGVYLEEGFQMVEKMHMFTGETQMRPIMISRWEVLA